MIVRLVIKQGGVSASDLMATLYRRVNGNSTLIMWYDPTLYMEGTIEVPSTTTTTTELYFGNLLLKMVMVMVMVKIDEQGRLIIPKEIREKLKLIGEVEIVEVKEGIILKPKQTLTWKKFYKDKLKMNWDEVHKLDLSEEDLTDLWI